MQTYKLGQLLNIQSGFAFKSEYFSDTEGFPIIRIRDISRGETKTYYTDKFSDEYVVKKGDFLIGMDGEFKCYKWKGGDALLNQRVCRLTTKEDSVYLDYIYYGINKFLKEIEDATPFVTVKHLSTRTIQDINFPLPPLATQRAIADKLDKLQSLIDLKKQAITKTDELAKSIFLEMFGDPMKNEKGREVKELSDVSIITMGQSPDGESYNTTGDGIPFFQGKAEFTDKYPIVKKRTTKPTKYAKVDDILMSVRAPVGDINLCNIDCCIGRGLASIRANKINLKYLYWILIFLKDSISDLGTGSTFKAISSNQLKTINIPLPPLPLQQKFADIIAQIEAQKSEHKLALTKLEELYQAEMQESFSNPL